MGMHEDSAGQKEDLVCVLLGSSVLLAIRRDMSRLKWEIAFANWLKNGQSSSEGQPKTTRLRRGKFVSEFARRSGVREHVLWS